MQMPACKIGICAWWCSHSLSCLRVNSVVCCTADLHCVVVLAKEESRDNVGSVFLLLAPG